MSWFDKLSKYQRREIRQWIKLLVERMWPVDESVTTLRLLEQRKNTAAREFLMVFSKAFLTLSAETELQSFTAATCYFFGTYDLKENAKLIAEPTIQNDWVITKEDTQFLNSRETKYWGTENGAIRMLCDLLEATNTVELSGHQHMVTTLMKGIQVIVEDFSTIFGLVMGPERKTMYSGDRMSFEELLAIHKNFMMRIRNAYYYRSAANHQKTIAPDVAHPPTVNSVSKQPLALRAVPIVPTPSPLAFTVGRILKNTSIQSPPTCGSTGPSFPPIWPMWNAHQANVNTQPTTPTGKRKANTAAGKNHKRSRPHTAIPQTLPFLPPQMSSFPFPRFPYQLFTRSSVPSPHIPVPFNLNQPLFQNLGVFSNFNMSQPPQ